MFKETIMNIYKIAFIAVLSVMLGSCRKYVENVPVQGQRVLVYTKDFRLLMNSTVNLETGSGNSAILGCDDIDLKDQNLQLDIASNNINLAMYTWSRPFYVELEADFDWNNMYNAMFTYNTVIAEVRDSEGGTTEEKNGIYAEGLVQRAFTYFTLVNSYGKQYDQATATTDLGVPILLEAKLFVDLKRATVAEVYAQILKDLETAIPLMPLTQLNSVKPNKAAAYALLAKVYLNMRNFDGAKQAAEQSLALSSEVLNYNLYTSSAFPNLIQNKQVLLRKTSRLSYSALQLSDELLNLLSSKDLRYKLFTRVGTAGYPAFSGIGFFAGAGADVACVGLTVNETWLIKAECLARGGQRTEALKTLNDFRKFRFAPADYVELTAGTDQQALELVIDERRREFFGTGLRWFDQKRLNKDPFFAKSRVRALGGKTYTLEPNSNAYVFPIAPILISQNPEIIQNPN